jgi:hypothetical protein
MSVIFIPASPAAPRLPCRTTRSAAEDCGSSVAADDFGVVEVAGRPPPAPAVRLPAMSLQSQNVIVRFIGGAGQRDSGSLQPVLLPTLPGQSLPGR